MSQLKMYFSDDTSTLFPNGQDYEINTFMGLGGVQEDVLRQYIKINKKFDKYNTFSLVFKPAIENIQAAGKKIIKIEWVIGETVIDYLEGEIGYGWYINENEDFIIEEVNFYLY